MRKQVSSKVEAIIAPIHCPGCELTYRQWSKVLAGLWFYTSREKLLFVQRYGIFGNGRMVAWGRLLIAPPTPGMLDWIDMMEPLPLGVAETNWEGECSALSMCGLKIKGWDVTVGRGQLGIKKILQPYVVADSNWYSLRTFRRSDIAYLRGCTLERIWTNGFNKIWIREQMSIGSAPSVYVSEDNDIFLTSRDVLARQVLLVKRCANFHTSGLHFPGRGNVFFGNSDWSHLKSTWSYPIKLTTEAARKYVVDSQGWKSL